MAAVFHEFFSTFGVDEGTKASMIVPFHGSNVVALSGGQNLKVVPKRDVVRAVKLGPSDIKQYIVQANQLGAATRGGGTLAEGWSLYAIHGDKLGGHDGAVINAVTDSGKVEASIQATILSRKTIKIAMRPVKVKDAKGDWLVHSQAKFDFGQLVQQMNQIWIPQSNIEFKLVSRPRSMTATSKRN